MRKSLPERLEEGVVLGDGAMGTMLYERGAFLNICFDELNLTRPSWVSDIHEAYVAAGVDLIETNTFGANALRLGKFGLADRMAEINTAAVTLARAAAGDEVMVAGAMGPLGSAVAPYGSLEPSTAEKAWREQAETLAEAGADFLMLETFRSKRELTLAVQAVASTNLPVVALLTVTLDQETLYGENIAAAAQAIAALPQVTAVGLNCCVGPTAMLRSLEQICDVVDKPIALLPNAGLPREVDGRTLYMCTPEYMAEYAKRFVEKGARMIGGCCGTTPEHISEIVKAVRAIGKANVAARVHAMPRGTETLPAEAEVKIPLAERSRLGSKLASGQPITTIEITPPRGFDLTKVQEKAALCAEYGIDAINIPDGPRASSRLSPTIAALKIKEAADIEPILHVCCRDRNLLGMQSDLLGAYAVGLHNVLIITGDPPKLGEYPDATAVFDLDAIGLTRVARNLNAGIDIGGNSFEPPLGLTLGVGANPVAAEMGREIERFKAKVDAGAEYAITQPVFDPAMLGDFMEATKSHRIPFVAGIWPFTSYKNAEFMANEVPGVVVPQELLKRMSTARTREQGRALGIAIAREMVAELTGRVAGFAVSAPFGNVRIALAVMGHIKPEDV